MYTNVHSSDSSDQLAMAAGRAIRFFAVGLLSAVVCWGGLSLLEESYWLSDLWPGLVYGSAITVLLQKQKQARFRWFPVALLLAIVVITTGWRLAIHTAIAVDGALSMVAAGAVGGISVAIAAILLQRNRHNAWRSVPILLLAGAIAAAIFDLTNHWTGRVDSDPLWALQLFATWQPLVLAVLAVVSQPQRSRLAPA
ncbi:MAG: hypothetical protein DHS20C11_33590 [Lysobacteraceae bacterium]|nr:MAG: hypothetical protein DHS20C11_33590 [Xanthomonadaceae bacterium]